MKSKQAIRFIFLSLVVLVFAAPASSQWVDRPVPAGVSIGNMDRPALDAPCAQGTLGCMLQTTYGLYGLSNRHVLDPGEGTARVTGRKGPGDIIVQPGPQQPSCAKNPSNKVGNLEFLVSIQKGWKASNKVDAARFSTTAEYLDQNGSIRYLGIIPSQTCQAYEYLEVKKSGMTTNVTHSVVVGIEQSIYLPWSNDVAKFVDQITVIDGSFYWRLLL
jgi:hypothetical protein